MKTYYLIFFLLSINCFFIQTTNAQHNLEYNYIFKLSNQEYLSLLDDFKFHNSNNSTIDLTRYKNIIDSCLHFDEEKFENKVAMLNPGNYLIAKGLEIDFNLKIHTVLPFQFYWVNDFPYTTIKLLDSKTNEVTKNAIIKMDTILIPFNDKLQSYTKANSLNEAESYLKGEMSIELDGIMYLFHDYPSSYDWTSQYSKKKLFYRRYIKPVLITFPFKYATIISHNTFTYLKKCYRTKYPKYNDVGDTVKLDTRYYPWSMLLYNKYRWPFNRKYRILIGSLTINKTDFSENDTLKLNAKVFVYNGKKYKKPIIVNVYPLSSKSSESNQIKFKIEPTKRGEYEFYLPCKNNLSVNSTYNVELSNNYSSFSNNAFLKSSFKISDKLHTSTKFEMYVNKSEENGMLRYSKNEPIHITFKSLDTNDFKRKISLKIHLPYISSLESANFIPETFFEQDILFHNQSSQTFTIPSYILPTGKYHLVIEAKFINSENQTNTKSLLIEYNNEPPLFITKLDSEKLSINLLRSDTTTSIKPKIIGYQNNIMKIEKEIDYNTTISLNQNIDRYEIEYGALKENIHIPHQVLISFKRTKKGLLQYKIENPHHIPISYTIFKDNNLLFLQDTCNQSIEKIIQYSKKHNYSVYAHFIWNGKLIKLSSSDFIYHKMTIKSKRKLEALKLDTQLKTSNKNAQTTYTYSEALYDRNYYDLYSKYNDDNPYELNYFYLSNERIKLVERDNRFYEPPYKSITKTEQLFSKFKTLKKNKILISYDSIENKLNSEFTPIILDSNYKPISIHYIYLDGKLTPFKYHHKRLYHAPLSQITLSSQDISNQLHTVELWTRNNKIYTLSNILFKPGMKLNLVFSESIQNKQVKCKQRVSNKNVFFPDYETTTPKTKSKISFLYPSLHHSNYDYIYLINQRNNNKSRIYNYLNYDCISDLDTGLYKLIFVAEDKKQFYLDSIHIPVEGTYYFPKDTKPNENQPIENIDFYSIDTKKLTPNSENLGSIYGNFTPSRKYNYIIQLLKNDSVIYTFKTNKNGYFEFVNIVPDNYQLKITNTSTHTSFTSPITLKKNRITVLKNIEINPKNNIVTFELLYSHLLHRQKFEAMSVE
jgi:hypothetical protein